MIPAQAVEAAAKVLYLEDHLWDEPWETASAAGKYRMNARVALEAAAPHILAAAKAEIAKLRAHILDIDAHATPFGDIPDDPDYVGAYLVSAGSLHRALGKIGHTSPSCEAEAELRQMRGGS